MRIKAVLLSVVAGLVCAFAFAVFWFIGGRLLADGVYVLPTFSIPQVAPGIVYNSALLYSEADGIEKDEILPGDYFGIVEYDDNLAFAIASVKYGDSEKLGVIQLEKSPFTNSYFGGEAWLVGEDGSPVITYSGIPVGLFGRGYIEVNTATKAAEGKIRPDFVKLLCCLLVGAGFGGGSYRRYSKKQRAVSC